MPLYVTLIIIVLATLWTTPVLSAVLKDDVDNIRDSRNATEISAIHQKLVNSTISDAPADTNNNNVDVSEARNYPNEELKEESRKKQQPDMMTRILPMMIIPFMLQTAIIPMMLTGLKFMLIKSAFIGLMAILLGLLNMFRVSTNQGGVYTHNIHLGHDQMHEKLAEEHYGYHGVDEYGAYVNRRKRSYR